ncbi:hypothetical protein [Hyphobacterium marinum]|uniref:Uncharacterized protein n=1 Tax=Hyphobacterium marinum TaxID=3116574 RepID=A0ABU7LYW7_9PROT|nr:hypothetical protein [Hyphobacterium sp. Y6023]MEE2566380.1 hypothetical protein [Hyphobacterium sp. Y6023]
MVWLLFSTLMLTDPVKIEPMPQRIENGRWVERQEDGSSGCPDPHARDIDIYYLMVPPHPRSPNTGDIRFGLGLGSGDYILTSVPQLAPPDPDGNRRLTLTGGIVHTVGIERNGVLSSFTRGRMEATFSLAANGDLHLRTLFFSERGRDAEHTVSDGRILETGTVLRAFEFCPTPHPERR